MTATDSASANAADATKILRVPGTGVIGMALA